MLNHPKLVFKGGWHNVTNGNHTNNISTNLGLIQAFFPHPDGTMIFLIVGTNVEVRSFSTSHDIGSVGGIIATFPIPDDLDPHGIGFSRKGDKMIICGIDTKTLYCYTLLTNWDVTSIVAPATSLSLSMIGSPQYFCKFSRDGDYVFVSDSSKLFSFPLPVAFDIESNTSNTVFDPLLSNPLFGFSVKPEGDKLFLTVVIENHIKEYDLSTPNDFSTSIFKHQFTTIGDIGDIEFRLHGTEFLCLDLSTDLIKKFHLSDAWNVSTASYHANNEPTLEADPRSISWKPDGTKYYILDFTAAMLTEFTVPNKFNQTGAIQTASFSVNSTQNRPSGMWWKPDGTRVYIIGFTQDRVNQLNVGTPWDVSTISDLTIELTLGGLGFPNGIFFLPDGLTFYIANSALISTINQYSLSIAWDILSILTLVSSLDVTTTAPNPTDLVLRNNGRTLLASSMSFDVVARFTVPNPQLIESAIFEDSLDISNEEISCNGIFMKQDNGKKLYIVGSENQQVISYDIIA